MKTDNELTHIAYVASNEVTTVDVTFEWKKERNPRMWTYVCKRTLAEGLGKGSRVLLEASTTGKLFSAGVVQEVHDEPRLEPEIHYRWVIRSLDEDVHALQSLIGWQKEFTRVLADAQRQKTRQAMLEQFGDFLHRVPRLEGPKVSGGPFWSAEIQRNSRGEDSPTDDTVIDEADDGGEYIPNRPVGREGEVVGNPDLNEPAEQGSFEASMKPNPGYKF